MNYDEQIKKWAAARLHLDVQDIKSVDFDIEDGFWYSEYTYEGPAFITEVRLTSSGPIRRIDIGRNDFGKVLQEIMDA